MRAVEKADGTVAIIIPAPGHTADEVQAKLPHLSGRPFADLAAPPNPDGVGRTFRDAWRLQGGALVHDITTARKIKALHITAQKYARTTHADVMEHADGPQGRAAWATYRRQVAQIADSVILDNINTIPALAAFEPPWPPEPSDA